MKKSRHSNEKRKSKTIPIILMVITIMILTAVSAYAYFTARDTKTNNIILGYNKIEVLEEYEPPLRIEKGKSFTKKPYVKNVGDVDCYVRFKSVVSDSRVKEGLEINYDNTDYRYDENDGYWYYQKAIKPGETTPSLFTEVHIKEDAGDEIQDGFDIYVYAESVQVVDGKNMDEVWDYFKNNDENNH